MFLGPNNEAWCSFIVISDVAITSQKIVIKAGTKFFGSAVLKLKQVD